MLLNGQATSDLEWFQACLQQSLIRHPRSSQPVSHLSRFHLLLFKEALHCKMFPYSLGSLSCRYNATSAAAPSSAVYDTDALLRDGSSTKSVFRLGTQGLQRKHILAGLVLVQVLCSPSCIAEIARQFPQNVTSLEAGSGWPLCFPIFTGARGGGTPWAQGRGAREFQ